MTEPPLRRLALCPVAGLLAPGHSITQLALDRRHEPPQAVLDDVVVRPRPHCRYRHLLAEGAGNEDKGNIELALVQQCQRLGTAEAGHRALAEDDVPGPIGRAAWRARVCQNV